MNAASTPQTASPPTLVWPALPLGFGTGRLCSLNGGLSIAQAADLLRTAYDLGIRFVDTAPSYGQGQAEQAIGALDSARREQLSICTKVGYSAGRKGMLINAVKPWVRPILPWAGKLRQQIASARDRAGAGGTMTVEIRPPVICSALDGSLRRLRRERVELFLLHDPSLESIKALANQQTLDDLTRRGKIGCWGISTNDPVVASVAAAVPGCRVIEMPGYPAWAEPNRLLFETCVQQQVDVIANGVLTPLTGNVHGPGEAGVPLSAECCIEFAYRRPGVKLVLCGARSAAHLKTDVEIMERLVHSGTRGPCNR